MQEHSKKTKQDQRDWGNASFSSMSPVMENFPHEDLANTELNVRAFLAEVLQCCLCTCWV